MIPSTATELFETKVPEILKTFRPVGLVYLIKIAGQGQWTLDLVSPEPRCTPGDTGEARCTIEMSYDDLRKMMLQPLASSQLYFSGKVKLSGAGLGVPNNAMQGSWAPPIALQKLQPFLMAIA